MRKIKTIFDRNWDGDKTVIDKLVVDFDFAGAVATEKLDGTNVRVTIRSGTCVRLEKRNNPSKLQKAKGIEEPWYIDADRDDPQDKWLFDALDNTELTNKPDGEWSAEAVGKNIQGNSLNLPHNVLVFFSLGEAPTLTDVPTTYAELKEWLPKQKSLFGNGMIEGIVWRHPNGDMVKIKTKDFIKDNR